MHSPSHTLPPPLCIWVQALPDKECTHFLRKSALCVQMRACTLCVRDCACTLCVHVRMHVMCAHARARYVCMCMRMGKREKYDATLGVFCRDEVNRKHF